MSQREGSVESHIIHVFFFYVEKIWKIIPKIHHNFLSGALADPFIVQIAAVQLCICTVCMC